MARHRQSRVFVNELGSRDVNNKAVLLRSVSAIATAAASTAGGMQHATAQSLAPGANGYYYSVSGGLMFSSSEKYLTAIDDKVGVDGVGSDYSSFYSSFYGSEGAVTSESAGSWSSYSSSYSSGLDDFAGFFGSVSFGKQLDPNWDIRGTVTGVNGGSTSGYTSASQSWWNSGYFSSYYYGSSYTYSSFNRGYNRGWADGTYKFGYLSADLEVGYTPVLSDTFNVRLFAGIRALSFESSFAGSAGGSGYHSGHYSSYSYDGIGSSYYGYHAGFSSYYFSGTRKVKFDGIGPRIGAQGSTRFEGTDFGLSGSVATSVLFGKKTVSSSGYFSAYSWESGYDSNSGPFYSSYSSAGSGSTSDSTNTTVLDVQASLGVDYYLNDNTALTVGYQAEKLFEIGGDDLGPGTSVDTLAHGAFIKLSGTF